MQTNDPYSEIIVVSGLPRSGTSLMMKMLAAGGLPLLVDGLRVPDDDNPEGYFEFEQVKALASGDHTWLPEAQGCAVKIISSLLKFLPEAYFYRVILMQRHMSEVLASQHRMLIRRGEPVDTLSDEKLGRDLSQAFAAGSKLVGCTAQHGCFIGGLQCACGRSPAVRRVGGYFSRQTVECGRHGHGSHPSALSESHGGLTSRQVGNRQRPC